MLPRSPASHRFGLGGHGSGPAHRTEVKRQGEIIDARPVAHEVEIGDRDQLPGEDRAEYPSRDPAQQPKSVSHIRRGLRVSQSQSPRTQNNFTLQASGTFRCQRPTDHRGPQRLPTLASRLYRSKMARPRPGLLRRSASSKPRTQLPKPTGLREAGGATGSLDVRRTNIGVRLTRGDHERHSVGSR